MVSSTGSGPRLPPDIVDPAVNDDRQQQFEVEPECEVAVRFLGAEVVHDLRLVQLGLQLVAQITRHCIRAQSMHEVLGLTGWRPSRLKPKGLSPSQATVGRAWFTLTGVANGTEHYAT